jgi:glycosyltransferase involved in cell wall biosynthesis
MKVLIDNQVYENQSFGGISRYFNELQYKNEFIEKMPPFIQNNGNKHLFYKRIQRKINSTFFKHKGAQNLKNDFYNLQLQQLEFDVFHPTYYDNYFLKQLKKPFVLTVHDMIHEKYPEYFGNSLDSFNKRRLCERADKIIAISNTTKNDLIDIFNVAEEKIEVIYHGTNFESIPALKPTIDFKEEDYILYTGSRAIYKNFLTFLIAVAPILKQNKNLQLICTGTNFNKIEKRWIEELALTNKVKCFFCKNDSELVYLYQNAECFVFPSLYEGFGFPLLEAFACNCPIVSSNGGSLKEIAGDAAIYFNPKDIITIRTSIQNVISDDTLKKELVNHGRIRIKDFSWEKCRLETNLVYSKVHVS